MKPSTYLWSIIALTILWLPAAQAAGREASAVAKPQAVKAYGHLPLSFEANQGQTDQRVKFLSHGSGYSLFLTGTGAVLALKRKPEVETQKSGVPSFSRALLKPESFPAALLPMTEHLKDRFAPRDSERLLDPESEATAVLRMTIVGANARAKVTGMEELPGKSNYFIGSDPKKWRTNVPNYARVKYRDVYPGVDLVYYGNQRQFEYDFVVQPGADPKAIILEVEASNQEREIGNSKIRTAGSKTQNLKSEIGAPLRVDANGGLVVNIGGGDIMFNKPFVYQRPSDEPRTNREVIDGRYVLKGNQVTFEVATYDKTRPLVIDPTLAYSTYLGGSTGNVGGGIAIDASGNAYVTGVTGSSDFPTTAGALQTTFGGGADVFVSKLNSAGSALLYSTYLGGSSFDQGTGVAIDAAGNAYIAGWTGSSDFPTTSGAFQTIPGGGGDAFVSKLNTSGSALLYSTYLGGSGFEGGNYFGIAVDGSGNAYVIGNTGSSDFPTTAGAFQTSFASRSCPLSDSPVNAFVSKLNASGSALLYSTYLGGSSCEEGTGIAVDVSGDAYVSGHTFSSDFPTTAGAFQTKYRGFDDAFVSKLNASGSALLYSTYLSGSNSSSGGFNLARFAIALDASGNAYVTGYTGASDFPTTPNAFQTTYGGGVDVFVSKLNASGSALLYSTYLGGSSYEQAGGIAVDASGNAYVTGRTFSPDFPTTSGAFAYGGSSDAFFSKLNASGSALVWSTYLGGSSPEDQSGAGTAIDASGNAYVTGETFSSDFPITKGAFQTLISGGEDAFVSKFSFGIPFSAFSGKLELDPEDGSFDLNAGFTLGPGGSINPPTQPVSLTIGTYSATIPAGSFVKHREGYAFEGVISGAALELLIKFGRTPGRYRLLAEGRGANLKGTTNPVTVTLSIGNDMGTTEIHAQFE